jgi:phage anti-repressor protein
MDIQISKQQFGNESVNSVSARELHTKLGVNKDFTSWIKVQIKRGMFDKNIDYIVVWHDPQKGVVNFLTEKELLDKFTNTQQAVRNGWQSDYILTLDTAKEIAMMSGTVKGKEVRNYFIEVEKQFRTLVGKEQNSGLVSLKERGELITVSKNMFIDFEDVFYRIGITRKEELAITSNRAVQKETGVDFIELAERKGVSTPNKYFTVTELCQKIISSDKFSEEAKKLVSTKAGDKPRPQNLNKLLQINGYQIKVDGIWKPTEKAKDLSDFVQNKSKHSEKTVFHLVWKVEILEELF